MQGEGEGETEQDCFTTAPTAHLMRLGEKTLASFKESNYVKIQSERSKYKKAHLNDQLNITDGTLTIFLQYKHWLW